MLRGGGASRTGALVCLDGVGPDGIGASHTTRHGFLRLSRVLASPSRSVFKQHEHSKIKTVAECSRGLISDSCQIERIVLKM